MSESFDIREAVRRGNLAEVRHRIEEDLLRLYVEFPGESSALMVAIESGNQEMVELLAAAVTRAIKAGRIPRERLYEAIHDLGEASFVEAESEVGKFLEDPDPELRYVAVSALSFHWGLPNWSGKLAQALQSDEDENVRRIAAAGLGYVMRGTKDPHLVRILIRRLRDSEESGSVRSSCYDALRSIWLGESESAKSVATEAEEVLASVTELERARIGSPEEFEAAMLRWEMEWLSKVNWDFVEDVERAVK